MLGSNGTLEWVTVAKAVFELAEAESRATAKSQEEVTAQEVTAQFTVANVIVSLVYRSSTNGGGSQLRRRVWWLRYH